MFFCEWSRTWNIDNRDLNWFLICPHFLQRKIWNCIKRRKSFIFLSSYSSIVLMCKCSQALYVIRHYIYMRSRSSSSFYVITLLFSIVVWTSLLSSRSTFYNICPICMYVSLDTQCQYKYWDYRYHQI